MSVRVCHRSVEHKIVFSTYESDTWRLHENGHLTVGTSDNPEATFASGNWLNVRKNDFEVEESDS